MLVLTVMVHMLMCAPMGYDPMPQEVACACTRVYCLLSSPDHPGCLKEDGWRNRDAERLGRLQIDDQVDLLRPLNGEVARLCTLQDSVHVRRHTAVRVDGI